MSFDYGALLIDVAGLFRRVFSWQVNLLGSNISLGAFVVFIFMVGAIGMFIKELLNG